MFSNPNKAPAVLTSDVINEAQSLFQMKSLKKEGCEPLISQNDLLFILRGIGMNPTQSDLEEVVSHMSVYDPDEKKDDKKKKKQREEEEKKKKKDDEDEKAKAHVLPEDVPKYAWLTLIEAVEMGYKNSRRCEDELIACLKVFEAGQRITLQNLISIMTSIGDDVLAPTEVEELRKLFANPDNPTDETIDIEHEVFAKTIQEGRRPPPPPPPEDAAPPPDDGSRKPSAA